MSSSLEKQLLARFLVIQRSRPELVQKLNDVIGTYEFSTIPRALFSADGQLLIPTDKSAVVKTLESHVDFENHADVEIEISESTRKICIIDAMAVVQTIKKGTKMTTCADFAQAFVSVIKKILHEYDEGRVIFDRYIEHSLKSQTRVKRTSGKDPMKFQVNDTTNIKNVPLKTFLSHIETKTQLTEYLGKRASLIARISKGYRNAINLMPPLAKNGWEIAHDILEPPKCLEQPALQAVLELVKCGCKGRCQGRSNCSCLKNDMPCTELCKCEDCENVRDYTADAETDDDSEEDEEIDT
ncbi:Hypothetical predicted protein [Paramuricea clavata]|uniref:Uncharacterized protein n=1 Tax=Paramuricea clavata TaxID=317549 RepID=A0A6S7I5N8_PARCT|nr:Hypothetical predicted protein [Paramuricea clavata]